jgi:hypothetical protein
LGLTNNNATTTLISVVEGQQNMFFFAGAAPGAFSDEPPITVANVSAFWSSFLQSASASVLLGRFATVLLWLTCLQSTVVVVDNVLIPVIPDITDDFESLADALTELQVSN